MFYHATWGPLVPSILKHGLGGAVPFRNYSDSESRYVYLSTCPSFAESMVEAADIGYEMFGEDVEIIILEVDVDPNQLSLDPNLHDNDGISLVYEGIIPPNRLTFCFGGGLTLTREVSVSKAKIVSRPRNNKGKFVSRGTILANVAEWEGRQIAREDRTLAALQGIAESELKRRAPLTHRPFAFLLSDPERDA